MLPGDGYYNEFVTASSGGAAIDADVLPTAVVTHNGVADPAFALTVAHLDTGHYSLVGTIPATYQGGDTFVVTITATIQTVVAKLVKDKQTIDRTTQFTVSIR
jgi:hypothetical protein